MPSRDLIGRVRSYAITGTVIGGGLCLFLIPAVLRYGNGPLPKYGITPLSIAGVYILSGLAGGLLFAVLYSLTRWFLGAFLLGMMVVLPAYLAFSILLMNDDSWSETVIIGLIPAFFVGGGVGSLFSSESHSRPIPSTGLVVSLWIVVAVCQVVGWYLGMSWPGSERAAGGLALVFGPPYVAALATLGRRRSQAGAAA